MTDSSIASSTSIRDSSPSSCWQGASNTSRQLSTTLIKSARWRCANWIIFKESEVDNQLHKNDNLKTQNAQEEYPGTRQKPEQILGPKNVFTDSSHKQENLVTQLFMAPQSSSMAPSRKKEGNNSIHSSAESFSIMSRQTFVASSSRSEILWMTCNRETFCSNIENKETSSLDQRNGRRGEPRAN